MQGYKGSRDVNMIFLTWGSVIFSVKEKGE